MWLTAARTLTRLAELGERAGRVFTLENLNTAVDHPGVPFARAADTLALVEAVDSPHLRLNLDLYHAQIGEGNLIQLLERALPVVGEIQVADVPGRCEPGTGEINYPAIAAALDRLGYTGVVGLEGWASGDPPRPSNGSAQRSHLTAPPAGQADTHQARWGRQQDRPTRCCPGGAPLQECPCPGQPPPGLAFAAVHCNATLQFKSRPLHQFIPSELGEHPLID